MEFLEKGDSPQEEALIQNLVLFGQDKIGESHVLADYIFDETDGEMIADPVLQAIYKQYLEFYSRGEMPPHRYFVSHPDPRIQEMVINWESTKHELSKQWQKFEIFVPDYRDVLGEINTRIIFRLALESVKKRIREIIDGLDAETDEEGEVMLLEELQVKTLEKTRIAEFLGSPL